jgi:hypothetical protein
MPSRLLFASIFATLQADGPAAGSRELIASPSLSTATQNDAEGHETAVTFAWQSTPGPCFPQSDGTEVGTFSVRQALAPPVGFSEVTTVPE